jgi:hypothetical protein
MIAVEEHTGVAVVSLARPPVNALDLPMIEELESTFARLANATPRIGVVLTGAGNTFRLAPASTRRPSPRMAARSVIAWCSLSRV